MWCGRRCSLWRGPIPNLSPDLYDVPNEMPTWTYTAVHLSGRSRVLLAEALPRIWSAYRLPSRAGSRQRRRSE
ncbi:FMN-binding negative transcriptional regulator [Falsiroseomonas sp. E2-1-a20]|uniref:FMN-binding negative transcriptional regulator n=1 Tax=Falsiroseomonas sp. E2-1-a20 TaxID=3239300 RepID=UPI003F32A958